MRAPLNLSLGWKFLLAAFTFVLAGTMPGVCLAAGQADYKLAAGDIISYDVLDDDDLARDLTVAADGRIQVPMLGNVPVAGMTTRDVATNLRDQLIQQKIFVDPRVLVAIASYRQIFVLGDVKNPGTYAFRANLTVEKAVGLAGGLLNSSAAVENQILERTKLQTQIEGLTAEIARAAVTYARLTAQLGGKPQTRYEDIPSAFAAFVDKDTFARLRDGEDKLLTAARAAFEGERNQLVGAIAETNNALQILNDLAKAQQATINYTKEDLARKSGLLSRGLNTIGDVSVLQRQLASDEARLLTIYAQTSESRRATATMKRELAKLESTRETDALRGQQDAMAKAEQLLSTRKSALEQLYYLSNWTSEAGQKKNQPVIQYNVRRDSDDTTEEDVSSNTSVFPGDTILVAIRRPILDGTPVSGQAELALGGSSKSPQSFLQSR